MFDIICLMFLHDSLLWLRKHQFLFEELVKRDFKKKYKGTLLGIGWSVLQPLLMLLVLKLVFEQFFGRTVPHYTTYLFCGQLLFHYFSESVGHGMKCLVSEAGIYGKVRIPKYIFLFAKNAQTFVNFLIILAVFFFFCALDHIAFTWKFLLLVYPILTLTLFNIGLGLILSALFVFFRDMDYLWKVFTRLLFYGSAIMYPITNFSPETQRAFFINPIYMHIAYFRQITINGTIPDLYGHLFILGCALAAFLLGAVIYRKCNNRFLYYI